MNLFKYFRKKLDPTKDSVSIGWVASRYKKQPIKVSYYCPNCHQSLDINFKKKKKK